MQPSYAPYALQIKPTLCGHHLLCKWFECCNGVLSIFMPPQERGTCLQAAVTVKLRVNAQHMEGGQGDYGVDSNLC